MPYMQKYKHLENVGIRKANKNKNAYFLLKN